MKLKKIFSLVLTSVVLFSNITHAVWGPIPSAFNVNDLNSYHGVLRQNNLQTVPTNPSIGNSNDPQNVFLYGTNFPTFNSYYFEREFLQVRNETNLARSGGGYSHTSAILNGDVLRFASYVHNNGRSTLNNNGTGPAVSTNTRFLIQTTNFPSNNFNVQATINSANASPNAVWDTNNIYTQDNSPMVLEYIPNSFYIRRFPAVINGINYAGVSTYLSQANQNNLFNTTVGGALIGAQVDNNSDESGIWYGCYEYARYLYWNMVARTPDLSVNIKPDTATAHPNQNGIKTQISYTIQVSNEDRTGTNMQMANMPNTNLIFWYDNTQLEIDTYANGGNPGPTIGNMSSIVWNLGTFGDGNGNGTTNAYFVNAKLLDGVGMQNQANIWVRAQVASMGNNSYTSSANPASFNLNPIIVDRERQTQQINQWYGYNQSCNTAPYGNLFNLQNNQQSNNEACVNTVVDINFIHSKAKRVTNLRTGIQDTTIQAMDGDELLYVLRYTNTGSTATSVLITDDISSVMLYADPLDPTSTIGGTMQRLMCAPNVVGPACTATYSTGTHTVTFTDTRDNYQWVSQNFSGDPGNPDGLYDQVSWGIQTIPAYTTAYFYLYVKIYQSGLDSSVVPSVNSGHTIISAYRRYTGQNIPPSTSLILYNRYGNDVTVVELPFLIRDKNAGKNIVTYVTDGNGTHSQVNDMPGITFSDLMQENATVHKSGPTVVQGDYITYKLTVYNFSLSPRPGFIVEDDISNIAPYVNDLNNNDIITQVNTNGQAILCDRAVFNNNSCPSFPTNNLTDANRNVAKVTKNNADQYILTFAPDTIPSGTMSGQTIIPGRLDKYFTVRVKTPLTMPPSATLNNVYGAVEHVSPIVNIEITKQARNLGPSNFSGQIAYGTGINTIHATGGDIIRFTLVARNISGANVVDYRDFTDYINDSLLAYAVGTGADKITNFQCARNGIVFATGNNAGRFNTGTQLVQFGSPANAPAISINTNETVTCSFDIQIVNIQRITAMNALNVGTNPNFEPSLIRNTFGDEVMVLLPNPPLISLLNISKTAVSNRPGDPNGVSVTGSIVYTINFLNAGTREAADVIIRDQVATILSTSGSAIYPLKNARNFTGNFISYNASAFNNSGYIIFNVGNVPPNTPMYISFTVDVKNLNTDGVEPMHGESIVNNVRMTASNAEEVNAQAITTVRSPLANIIKTISAPTGVTNGSTINTNTNVTFDLQITNYSTSTGIYTILDQYSLNNGGTATNIYFDGICRNTAGNPTTACSISGSNLFTTGVEVQVAPTTTVILRYSMILNAPNNITSTFVNTATLTQQFAGSVSSTITLNVRGNTDSGGSGGGGGSSGGSGGGGGYPFVGGGGSSASLTQELTIKKMVSDKWGANYIDANTQSTAQNINVSNNTATAEYKVIVENLTNKELKNIKIEDKFISDGLKITKMEYLKGNDDNINYDISTHTFNIATIAPKDKYIFTYKLIFDVKNTPTIGNNTVSIKNYEGGNRYSIGQKDNAYIIVGGIDYTVLLTSDKELLIPSNEVKYFLEVKNTTDTDIQRMAIVFDYDENAIDIIETKGGIIKNGTLEFEPKFLAKNDSIKIEVLAKAKPNVNKLGYTDIKSTLYGIVKAEDDSILQSKQADLIQGVLIMLFKSGNNIFILLFIIALFTYKLRKRLII